MAVMISAPLDKPAGEAFTAADLELMPDDGRRYEIIDGVLIVSPSPAPRHQQLVLELAVRLREACPDTLRTYVAPLDVKLDDNTVMEPDVLVARRSDVGETNIPTAPLLAVEVLSPRTRAFDLNLKAERLARAGCPSYWTIDPEGPRLIARELRESGYVVTADVSADEVFAADLPYPVSFRVGDLLEK